jgi:hypothetical protein
MKFKSILFLFLLLSISCNKNTNFKVIGTPKIIGNLLVAEKDFPRLMDWNTAMSACASLDSGWRLPTIDELRILHLYSDSIGGFTLGDYWSSTKTDALSAWHLYFFNGSKGGVPMFNENYVRAVRSK